MENYTVNFDTKDCTSFLTVYKSALLNKVTKKADAHFHTKCIMLMVMAQKAYIDT